MILTEKYKNLQKIITLVLMKFIIFAVIFTVLIFSKPLLSQSNYQFWSEIFLLQNLNAKYRMDYSLSYKTNLPADTTEWYSPGFNPVLTLMQND